MINRFRKEYDFLSNFYICEPNIMYKGNSFPTVEHIFQAEKISGGLGSEQAQRIIYASSPAEAKRLGRSGLMRDDWERVKNNIMLDALRAKFSEEYLKYKLLSTTHRELVEGNFHHDNYWGDCYCSKCKDIAGKNMLGKLLMKLREEIRNG